MGTSRVLWRRVCVWALIMLLAGCANLQTLNRKTPLPFSSGKGRAIHLDAQQRLVVFAAEGYCAEPSPDALAAYAAALGVGAGSLPGNTASGSAALNGMAGSIGLRTQSITLMRDTLYRTCEMMLNGKLSAPQISVLMARSQDLTVVIMAIESLTGAVVAPPVTLAPSGSATATAAIVSNAENLSAARERQGAAKKRYDETKAAVAQATKTHLDARTAVTTAAANVTDTTPEDDPLREALAQAVKRESEAAAALQAAEQEAALAKQDLDAWTDTVAMLEKLKDSAMAGSTASVGGLANAGLGGYRSTMDSATAAHISSSVENMVTALLEKSYFNDTCLAVFTNPDFRRTLESRSSASLEQACLRYWELRGREAR